MKSGPMLMFAATALLSTAMSSHADLWLDEAGAVVGVSSPNRTFVTPAHKDISIALCRLSAKEGTFLTLDLSFDNETGEIASMGFEPRDPAATRWRPHPLQTATEPCGEATLKRFQFDWMIATARIIDVGGDDVFSLAAPYTEAAFSLTRDRRADALKGRWAIQEFRVKGHEHLPPNNPLNFQSDLDPVKPSMPPGQTSRAARYDCSRDFDTFLFDGALAYQSLGHDFTTEFFVAPKGENSAVLRYSRTTGSMSHHCELESGNVRPSTFRALDGVMLTLDPDSGDLVGGISGKRMTRDGMGDPYESSDDITLKLRRRAARPAE